MIGRVRAWLRREDGFGPVETAIVITAVLPIFLLLAAFGRYYRAVSSVDAASLMAARAASIARTAGEAQGAAETAADTQLSQDGVSCSDRSVDVDTSGFGTRPGDTAFVRVDVTCTTQLGDLNLPGLPSSKSISSNHTSVIDTYRERALGATTSGITSEVTD